MISIALIDDNHDFTVQCSDMIKISINQPYTLNVFYDSKSFMDSVQSGNTFHIIMMDIMLDKTNGIDILKEFQDTINSDNIIFISSEPSFFSDVYAVRHQYFITKPLQQSQLNNALNCCVRNVKNRYVSINLKTKSTIIDTNNVMYIAGNNRTATIYYSDNSEQNINMPLEKLAPSFHDIPDFLRIHKSFLVNLTYMISSSQSKLTMPYNYTINISRSYIEEVNTFITHWLANNTISNNVR